MNIDKLMKNSTYEHVSNLKDVDITDISFDSRKTKPGHLFVAIDGIDDDGHRYIQSAIEKGAEAIVLTKDFEEFSNKFRDIVFIKVADSRVFLAQASACFFGYPAEYLKITGITGTNGKTTISHMIANIYKKAGVDIGIIGTTGVYYKDIIVETDFTTPSSYDLQKFFNTFKKENVDTCVMEVSSIALKQKRVYGVYFDSAIYTNLTQAHITKREHSDFSDYAESKRMIFDQSDYIITGQDDENVRKAVIEYKSINSDKSKIFLSAGLTDDCDVYAKDVEIMNHMTRFSYIGLGKKFDVTVDIPGIFNIQNALFAITVCIKNGIPIEYIQQGLKDVKVRGRCEKVQTAKDYQVIIDYAHTPDSLLNLLSAVKDTRSSGRIICLFGAGGDRDNSMRPLMGKISGDHADYSIITSDNSRTENPEIILDMIESGIKSTNGEYIRITDRTQAIAHALYIAKKDDIIILAGKGHETYLDVMGVKTHYDEREVIREILRNEI